MQQPLHTVNISHERHVVLVRQRGREIAGSLGFDAQDQVRIATALSEIARNAFRYAGGGKATFLLESEPQPVFRMVIEDRGPGIQNLPAILSGTYVSTTGMGRGLVGSRRLMDEFDVQSSAGKGTRVQLGKFLPLQKDSVKTLQSRTIADLAAKSPEDPLAELERQNGELLGAMTELQVRENNLRRLNHELEDTNRGVVALYAELDERAGFLRKTSELKTRFLSNMTHEFRTPLNSILSLSRMLLDRLDGELGEEQEKQVGYIRKAAEELSELVNDLLDLAKVEAGKVELKPEEFDVVNLFGTLRGMLRPLLNANGAVNLIFEDPLESTRLNTDLSKVSQILRNFISNALKFTDRGEIRVSARMEGLWVYFKVADTGMGIAQEDLTRIFEEYIQVEGAHQAKSKGTGLGLPIARKYAELLGGKVQVESTLGVGSTFSLRIPAVYSGPIVQTL